MLLRILSIAAALLLASCASPAEVEVVNDSGTVVADILVLAPGATAIVGNLNPGQHRTVAICPSRDSSLDLKFIARGGERTVPARTFVECSGAYRIALTIQPDLSVRAVYKTAPPGHR